MNSQHHDDSSQPALKRRATPGTESGPNKRTRRTTRNKKSKRGNNNNAISDVDEAGESTNRAERSSSVSSMDDDVPMLGSKSHLDLISILRASLGESSAPTLAHSNGGKNSKTIEVEPQTLGIAEVAELQMKAAGSSRGEYQPSVVISSRRVANTSPQAETAERTSSADQAGLIPLPEPAAFPSTSPVPEALSPQPQPPMSPKPTTDDQPNSVIKSAEPLDDMMEDIRGTRPVYPAVTALKADPPHLVGLALIETTDPTSMATNNPGIGATSKSSSSELEKEDGNIKKVIVGELFCGFKSFVLSYRPMI